MLHGKITTGIGARAGATVLFLARGLVNADYIRVFVAPIDEALRMFGSSGTSQLCLALGRLETFVSRYISFSLADPANSGTKARITGHCGVILRAIA